MKGESDYVIRISEDEATVLGDFFHRLVDMDRLELAHPGELAALFSLAAQLEGTTAVPFGSDYAARLKESRTRLVEQYGGSLQAPDVADVVFGDCSDNGDSCGP